MSPPFGGIISIHICAKRLIVSPSSIGIVSVILGRDEEGLQALGLWHGGVAGYSRWAPAPPMPYPLALYVRHASISPHITTSQYHNIPMSSPQPRTPATAYTACLRSAQRLCAHAPVRAGTGGERQRVGKSGKCAAMSGLLEEDIKHGRPYEKYGALMPKAHMHPAGFSRVFACVSISLNATSASAFILLASAAGSFCSSGARPSLRSLSYASRYCKGPRWSVYARMCAVAARAGGGGGD